VGNLDAQHAFVTGGGSGIGLACAKAFAADGATVTITGRSESRLHDALEELGDGHAAISLDVADEGAVEEAVKQAHERIPITIAVANAGTGAAHPFFDTPAQSWREVMSTNLDGTFYTFKHAGQAIAERGGAMCAVSSIAGLRTHRLMSAYTTSKAAIDMLVRNAADELGVMGVRVNSVCPGLVVTELSRGLYETDPIREDYLACMPVARLGQVEDIAHAVRFLCGPEASWVTGVVMPVDGGHHLRRGPDLLAGTKPS